MTQPNRAPTTVGSIANLTLTVGESATAVDVSGYFSDPDGDTLTYTATSSDTAKATVSVSSATVSITPVEAGAPTVNVIASDGSLSAKQTISVEIAANLAPGHGRNDVRPNTGCRRQHGYKCGCSFRRLCRRYIDLHRLPPPTPL